VPRLKIPCFENSRLVAEGWLKDDETTIESLMDADLDADLDADHLEEHLAEHLVELLEQSLAELLEKHGRAAEYWQNPGVMASLVAECLKVID
jgi:hypothetical protein